MSSRRPDESPSSSHHSTGAPAENDHNQEAPTAEQRSTQTPATRLAYYQGNTTRLLEFLRQTDQDSLDRFISLIRSGASHDDIFATIDQMSAGTGQGSSKQNGTSG